MVALIGMSFAATAQVLPSSTDGAVETTTLFLTQ
jgi:hypothetical protein